MLRRFALWSWKNLLSSLLNQWWIRMEYPKKMNVQRIRYGSSGYPNFSAHRIWNGLNFFVFVLPTINVKVKNLSMGKDSNPQYLLQQFRNYWLKPLAASPMCFAVSYSANRGVLPINYPLISSPKINPLDCPSQRTWCASLFCAVLTPFVTPQCYSTSPYVWIIDDHPTPTHHAI